MTHTAKRATALRQILRERQHDIQRDLQGRIRRTRDSRPEQGRDHLEHADDGVQEGLGLALLQMKTELLARIEEALRQLEAGGYGACTTCGREIAARRLRALPFAVRCQACQSTREALVSEGHRINLRHGGVLPSLIEPLDA